MPYIKDLEVLSNLTLADSSAFISKYHSICRETVELLRKQGGGNISRMCQLREESVKGLKNQALGLASEEIKRLKTTGTEHEAQTTTTTTTTSQISSKFSPKHIFCPF